MNQHSRTSAITPQLSEINKKIIYLSSGGHIFPAICILADHTRKMARLHKLDQIANCTQLANKLYLDGNESEQHELTTVFSGLFSSLRTHYTKSEWDTIKKYIPYPLYKACLLTEIRKNQLSLKRA